MGSMGESDRKRRHFSSLSPTAAPATAKKLPLLPISEDKKLDIAVLQFQNQKLMQKLETQKLEYTALEDKFSQLKERQQSYGSNLAVVKKNWEQLVNDLELCSEHARESSSNLDSRYASVTGVCRGVARACNSVVLQLCSRSRKLHCCCCYSWGVGAGICHKR